MMAETKSRKVMTIGRMENFMEKNSRTEEITAAFAKKCEDMGIALGSRQIQDFLVYYEYLTEQNKVMNLTAITDFEEVLEKHFVDSLSIVKGIDMMAVKNMIDVGTGAGFPGLPLKIAFPHLKVVLLDSLNKRVNFLNQMIDKLRYTGITAVHGRAEDLARKKEHREAYDLCVSRAVANLSSLSEYCLPFVRTGGRFVSYKSAKIEEEMDSARSAVHVLGGKLTEKKDFLLPGSDLPRSLVIVQKIRNTPARYPRKAGMPTKEPLHG